jgi:hypothetical protein
MSFVPDLLELGHNEGVPADTLHHAGHRLNSNLAAIQAEFTNRAQYIWLTIDGGGVAIADGVKGWVDIWYPGTITGWRLLGDRTGTITIDLRVCSYDDYPPTSGNSIVGLAPPQLLSAAKAVGDADGWTSSALYPGDIIGFASSDCSLLQRVTLTLEITR